MRHEEIHDDSWRCPNCGEWNMIAIPEMGGVCYPCAEDNASDPGND